MSAKILVVIGSLDSGGCERHLLTAIPLLKKHGYDIRIVTLSRPGVLAPAFIHEGISVISPWVRAPSSQRLIPRLIRLMAISVQFVWTLTKLRPKLVHMYLPASYWIGGPLSLLFSRTKRVMSRRSLNTYQDNSTLVRRYEAFLHQRMDFILGNSMAVCKHLIDEGSPKHRTGLIYNGVKLPAPGSNGSRLRDTLGISDHTVILVIVANLIPYKGHEDLLHALYLLFEKGIANWTLLVVGRDDGIGDHLQKIAEDLKIRQKVCFLGSQDNIPDILEISDIGLLISHQEGFSNSILEYMAAGLPTIATNVGGNGEAIENGRSGFIIPPKSPEALAQALQELIESTELRQKMGISAKKKAEVHFSVNKMISDYAYMYECVLNDEVPEKLCIKN